MKKIHIPKAQDKELALSCLVANEHLLIEDIPGTGKTQLAKDLSKFSKLPSNRIQCTNDLMPADVLGYYRLTTGNKLKFIEGPVFTNILLIDELNRAPSRTQSALLEAMEELQVTIEGKTYKLPDPFFVIATQNPREQIGIFDLPESQLDRFSICINMDHKSKEDYLEIMNQTKVTSQQFRKNILTIKKKMKDIHFEDSLKNYLLNIFENIENIINKNLAIRPRLQIRRLAEAMASIDNRDFVIPEDILTFIVPSLRHRLSTNNYEEIHEIVIKALEGVKTP
jgi:MoxR-like ATPase